MSSPASRSTVEGRRKPWLGRWKLYLVAAAAWNVSAPSTTGAADRRLAGPVVANSDGSAYHRVQGAFTGAGVRWFPKAR